MRSSGVGFTGALQLIFIVLKLLNIINWSWWAVLAPLWFSIGAFIVGIILIVIFWKD